MQPSCTKLIALFNANTSLRCKLKDAMRITRNGHTLIIGTCTCHTALLHCFFLLDYHTCVCTSLQYSAEEIVDSIGIKITLPL